MAAGHEREPGELFGAEGVAVPGARPSPPQEALARPPGRPFRDAHGRAQEVPPAPYLMAAGARYHARVRVVRGVVVAVQARFMRGHPYRK